MTGVVTLCGSLRFFQHMLIVASHETMNGSLVFMPFLAPHGDHSPVMTEWLDTVHRRKIDLSDRVIIVSDDTGYIGDSTRAEIDYATGCGIAVAYRHLGLR